MKLAEFEFYGGLYPQGGEPEIVVEAAALRACLQVAGARFKLGTHVKRGVIVLEDSVLVYPDPQSAEERWEAGCHMTCVVTISQRKIDRTRPMFEEWWLDTTYHYNPTVLDEDQLWQILELAGEQVGLLDWRPAKGGKYGRFTVEEVEYEDD